MGESMDDEEEAKEPPSKRQLSSQRLLNYDAPHQSTQLENVSLSKMLNEIKFP